MPDMSDPRWALLRPSEVSNLRYAFDRDRGMFKILRDQALATAAARQRSIERADRRAMEIAAANLAQEPKPTLTAADIFDISDLPPDTQEWLLAIRRSGGVNAMIEYAAALGQARLEAAERRKVAEQAQ